MTKPVSQPAQPSIALLPERERERESLDIIFTRPAVRISSREGASLTTSLHPKKRDSINNPQMGMQSKVGWLITKNGKNRAGEQCLLYNACHQRISPCSLCLAGFVDPRIAMLVEKPKALEPSL